VRVDAMTELRYKLTNDLLFKILFVRHQDMLKRLVALLLGIRLESIKSFLITNTEIPPEVIKGKYCRLDVNMDVDGQRVDLEVQVNDEGDYPERVLYYWARDYSTALKERESYTDLPRTVIINIVAFKMFDCDELYSVYEVRERTRHSLLTDRLCLIFCELPKLSELVDADAEDELKLWLTLFNAKTEEDLLSILKLGVPIMEQAIEAYRTVTTEEAFRELERARHFEKTNRWAALGNARREGLEEGIKEGIKEGEQAERRKWQGIVADKDALINELLSRLGNS
jgi:predicted transposase/invertase (TIGR01784 family)